MKLLLKPTNRLKRSVWQAAQLFQEIARVPVALPVFFRECIPSALAILVLD
ncbi:MAG: hypothetical protein KME26_32535 [Oscillatoria princeps RMCB-10]|nr:hypothetical protein [Oscillatoria princeps RMCB-10]